MGIVSHFDMKKQRKNGLKPELLDNAAPEPNSGCLIWQRGKTGQGYGCLGVNGKIVPAHRRSYELYVGPIPEGMLVCHRCDTPLCINPDHLFLGTAKDNVQDCVMKGRARGNISLGESNPTSILTEDKVRQIRRDNRMQSTIAAEYGVSRALICMIKKRKIWRHIDG